MNSTLAPNANESDAALAARADERLAHAYEQIARADEQLAHLTEQLSKMEQAAAHHPSAVLDQRSSRGRPMLRGFFGLLLAACIGAAALVSQSSYGEAIRPAIAEWTPYFISTSSLRAENPALPAQGGPSGVQLAAVGTEPVQVPPSAKTTEQSAAPTVAPASPELTELLQTVVRELANVEQGLEQLKARQEQMADDNARAVEQLKASQEQMARLIAKPSEQSKPSELNPRATTTAPPPRPVANATRNKPPPVRSSQAKPQPQPLKLQPDEQ